ncbi:hypothetical protein AB0L74_26980 [Streptomyces sp. NPDC052020]|uniref:hypothetical protein n=1 Tax=Streptomyces sp. NPDC052020 TaxID=3155677 RepID=UPI00343E2FAE
MVENSRVALESYVNARRSLLAAMLADHRAGVSANDIADTVRRAWSRPVTLEYLSTWELADRARAAVNAAGLGGLVQVRTTGDIAGPRRVLLRIACDPDDTAPDLWATLPDRIAAALTEAGISWAFPDGPGVPLARLLDDVDEVTLRNPLKARPGRAPHPAHNARQPHDERKPSMTVSNSRATALNRAARFLPADPADPTTLPCIEIAGVQVYAYIRDGRVCVSVDLETAEAELVRPDGTVPLTVDVGVNTVFEG